jgi:hypothetical protein
MSKEKGRHCRPFLGVNPLLDYFFSSAGAASVPAAGAAGSVVAGATGSAAGAAGSVTTGAAGSSTAAGVAGAAGSSLLQPTKANAKRRATRTERFII